MYFLQKITKTGTCVFLPILGAEISNIVSLALASNSDDGVSIIAASSVPCSQQTYDLMSIFSEFENYQNYPQDGRLEVNFSPKLITISSKNG